MDRRLLQKSVKEKLTSKYDDNESSKLAQYLIEDLIPIDHKISSAIINEIEIAANRILADEPLQYVTNRADFYGLQFYVNEAVLIPRPETEELVYNVIQYLNKNDKDSPKVLDIGTGSGCIPIAVKKEKEHCDMSAIDISTSALKIAIRNANSLGAEVTFIRDNILENGSFYGNQRYDIIISNPPYIPYSERDKMSASTIKHEPNIALFTEDEYGLIFYQRIASLCKSWLEEDGAAFLELNEFHADKIKNIFIEQGIFKSVDVLEDMQGKQRILVALR